MFSLHVARDPERGTPRRPARSGLTNVWSTFQGKKQQTMFSLHVACEPDLGIRSGHSRRPGFSDAPFEDAEKDTAAGAARRSEAHRFVCTGAGTGIHGLRRS